MSNRDDSALGEVSAELVNSERILEMRDLYREEMDCQIIHYSWLERRWYDPYLLSLNGESVGYGCVGGIRGKNKVTANEFYVLPEYRGAAQQLFREFVSTSSARKIECQTNDRLLTLMMYDSATRIRAGPVLFNDSVTTNLVAPEAIFRRNANSDRKRGFPSDLASDAEYVIEVDGWVVAAGGVLYHYNPPYGDVYMAVSEPYRRRGYGSYLVQELKRVCRESGRIPAARCNSSNAASRATLQKAGLFPCARLLNGLIRP